MSCIHMDLHREHGMCRLIKMYHKHVSTQVGHPATQGDLVLEKQEQLWYEITE